MPRDAGSKAIYLEDYRPPEFLVDKVELKFDLREQGTRVASRINFRRNLNSQDRRDELRLHGEGLHLHRLSIDGRTLAAGEYRLDNESLTVLLVPDSFVLETEAEIAPEKNTALEGLYRSAGMFCTQCEAEGFRRITWYLDRPDVMAPFVTHIEADRKNFPVLLSNGNPRGGGELEQGRHFAVWEDPFPKPCYLFALVAGDLRFLEDWHTTPSGKDVRLRIYVEPENLSKCDHAMRSLQHAMVWDEQKYGREYDLDVYNVVAVNDFNMGAMENKGLNIFNSKYVLARPETATDQDYQGIEGVIAHEYFHNWTGNRVTCRDWFQLSLKEGFTVYRDQEFSADMGSRGVKRIEGVRLLRAHQFAEDAGPMAHPVRPGSYIEINNFYTLTVYEKGAELVRMQAQLLGPELFSKATDLYFERHDGQAVTTDDFVRCMADASGRDLSQFQDWYRFAGTPEVTVTDRYDPKAKTYALVLHQACPDTPGQTDKPPFHIPFSLGLLDNAGKEMPLQLEGEETAATTRLLELKAREETFVFTGIEESPAPSLLRGFSAPVKVRYPFSDEQLMFLMAKDPDGFNRWDAAQTLAQRVILRMVEARSAGGIMQVPSGFLEAVRQALGQKDVDKAILTEALVLPAESYLGEQMETVDVEGIHLAREQLRSELAAGLYHELRAVYRDNQEQGEYALDNQSIARRRLKNLALGYLMMANDRDEAVTLSLAQFRAQHNMTDVLVAMGLLADSDRAEREQVLEDFYRRWRGDPLVMDKWFSVQASAKGEDTLKQVKRLLRHPAFSIRNPNKVRALIGTFAGGNLIQFHNADGSGYRFLVDRVLEIDPLNPQIAARLLRNLARWRRYDQTRSQLMRGQLERVVAAAKVSKDVYEVATKSLQE